MAKEPKEYSNLAVLPTTKRKIQLLSGIKDEDILVLVGAWADTEWEKAKKEGLVTDAMLKPSPSKQKKSALALEAIAA